MAVWAPGGVTWARSPAADPCARGPWPLGDAPGAAGEELGAGDLLAGLDRCLDRRLVGFGGGGDCEPLGIELGVLGDVDGLGAGAAQLVIGEGEAG